MGWFSFQLVLETNRTDAQLSGDGLALIQVAPAYLVLT